MRMYEELVSVIGDPQRKGRGGVVNNHKRVYLELKDSY